MIKSLQHLKALQSAPQGTLAFRSYLLMRFSTILYNKAFGSLKLNIPLFHLSEQCRIAGILNAADRKLDIEEHIMEEADYA